MLEATLVMAVLLEHMVGVGREFCFCFSSNSGIFSFAVFLLPMTVVGFCKLACLRLLCSSEVKHVRVDRERAFSKYLRFRELLVGFSKRGGI